MKEAQSVATANSPPARAEFTAVNMEMKNSEGGTQIAITMDESTPEFPTATPHPAQFHTYSKKWYLVYAAVLLQMFPSMTALVSLKFQNNSYSAFQTHGSFANMAVVAYVIAIFISLAMFLLEARFENETWSPICYKIIHTVFYFFALLAPLSFVLVLLLPQGFDMIGYSIVLTLLILVVSFSFGNDMKLLCKKDESIDHGSSQQKEVALIIVVG